VDLRRENDVEQLRRIALAQQVQIEQLLRVLSAKCEKLQALKCSPEELQQTLALLNELTAKAQKQSQQIPPSKPRGKPKPRTDFGPTEQPDLPIAEKKCLLDEPDRVCPACGGGLEPMPGQFEDSEFIDFVEISYRLLKVKQQKYVCRCGGCVETAPGPERAIKGGRYSLAFAIKVALDKYLDHLPLARQQRILKRHGVIVTPQTLWDQAWIACCRPGIDSLRHTSRTANSNREQEMTEHVRAPATAHVNFASKSVVVRSSGSTHAQSSQTVRSVQSLRSCQTAAVPHVAGHRLTRL
jgi:transposase